MKLKPSQLLIFICLSFNSIYLNGQYYLYDDDCLDFYVADYPLTFGTADVYYGKQHQIIPFCRYNSFVDHYHHHEFMVNEPGVASMKFEELNLRNISSLQLYMWSIHMDLVEEYQAFLENINGNKIVSSNLTIFNCSLIRKFGRFCQYSFNSQMSFSTIAKDIFKKARFLTANGTCFWHLNCKRNNISWCLDWSEVCDGVVHCWPNPVDEQYCQILEQNECAKNEYRCFDGQCIPNIFLLDKTIVPDCLDYTDENVLLDPHFQVICRRDGDPSFRCSEVKCRHRRIYTDDSQLSSCGPIYSREKHSDQIDQNLLSLSANEHISEECWATMICLIQVQYRIDLVSQTSSTNQFEICLSFLESFQI